MKVKLTPKDCLYIDDALTQLCAIKTRINEEVQQVNDKDVTTHIKNVENAFTTHFDALKKLLKEAK